MYQAKRVYSIDARYHGKTRMIPRINFRAKPVLDIFVNVAVYRTQRNRKLALGSELCDFGIKMIVYFKDAAFWPAQAQVFDVDADPQIFSFGWNIFCKTPDFKNALYRRRLVGSYRMLRVRFQPQL